MSMSTNTTNTNDRAGDGPRQAPARENADAPLSGKLAAAVASLPDPLEIARLANELFAALPGNPAVGAATAFAPSVIGTEVGVAPMSAEVPTDTSRVPDAVHSPESRGSFQPHLAMPEPAMPGSAVFYFLDAEKVAARNAAPAFPPGMDMFSFPGAPGLQPQPGLTVLLPTPAYFFEEEKSVPWNAAPTGPAVPAVSEVFSFPGIPDLPATPESATALTSEPSGSVEPASLARHSVPGASSSMVQDEEKAMPSPLPGSLAYFLQHGEAAPQTAALKFPSPSQVFSFQGVPGAQSLPGLPPLPSSPPTEADLRVLPASLAGDTALVPKSRETVSSRDVSASQPARGEESANAVAPAGPKSFEFRPGLVADLGPLSRRPFDAQAIRRDFPILQEQVHGRPLIWLDNAATTQKPQSVIDRTSHFYEHENSNIHRAAHTLAARATDAYESAREKVRRFLNAPSTREIVFVRGATEAINLVAQSWGRRHVVKDDEIVITWLEHHSNIVPWQLLCADKGARLRVAPIDDDGQILLDEYEKLLGPKTRLVSITQVSNALGTVLPVRKMVEIAHRYGARVLIDGAQSVAHMRTDVQALDCDFYAFSGHKIFAPTGIGVLYGKPDALAESPPWQGGGSMIIDVTFEKTVYQTPPARFEAGTGNIADAVGLGAALDYLDEVGMENIARHEHELLLYGTEQLRQIPGLRLVGTAKEKASVMSFVLDGYRTEDVGAALDREGIAVRAGHHCAQPTLRRFGLETTVRPSLALYNTREDIDALIAALNKLAVWNHRGPARIR
jgi:cysteine desulfurase/selenocysteine lyase